MTARELRAEMLALNAQACRIADRRGDVGPVLAELQTVANRGHAAGLGEEVRNVARDMLLAGVRAYLRNHDAAEVVPCRSLIRVPAEVVRG